MLIFCRCCEYLGVKDEKLYCTKLETIKQSETAENYHSCTEYQYYFRPEKPDTRKERKNEIEYVGL